MKRSSLRSSDFAAARRSFGGFTLIELLIVMAIIGLLAGIALVALGGARGFFAGATAKSRLTDVSTALELYKTKYGEYPPDSCASTCCVANPDPVAREKARGVVKRHILKRWPKALKSGKIETMIDFVGDYCKTSPGKALLFWLAGPDAQGFSADEQYPFGENAACVFGVDESRETPTMELSFDSDGKNGGNYNDDLGLMFQGKPIAYFRAESGSYAKKHFELGGGDLAQPYLKGGKWFNADSFQLIFPGEDGLFGEDDCGEDESAHRERDLADGASISAADRDNVVNFGEGATLDAEIE